MIHLKTDYVKCFLFDYSSLNSYNIIKNDCKDYK